MGGANGDHTRISVSCPRGDGLDCREPSPGSSPARRRECETRRASVKRIVNVEAQMAVHAPPSVTASRATTSDRTSDEWCRNDLRSPCGRRPAGEVGDEVRLEDRACTAKSGLKPSVLQKIELGSSKGRTALEDLVACNRALVADCAGACAQVGPTRVQILRTLSEDLPSHTVSARCG